MREYDIRNLEFYFKSLEEKGVYVPKGVLLSLENVASYVRKSEMERTRVSHVCEDNTDKCDIKRYGLANATTDMGEILTKLWSSAYNDAIRDMTSANKIAYTNGLNDAWNTQREIDNMNMFERQEAFGKGKTDAVEITAENDAIEAMHKILEWKKRKSDDKCCHRRDTDYCEQNDDFCSCVDSFKCTKVSIKDFNVDSPKNPIARKVLDNIRNIDDSDIIEKYKNDIPLVNRMIKGAQDEVLEDIYVALMEVASIYLTKDGANAHRININKCEDIYTEKGSIKIHIYVKAGDIDEDVEYVNGIIMNDQYGFPVYKKDFDKEYIKKDKNIDIHIDISAI